MASQQKYLNRQAHQRYRLPIKNAMARLGDFEPAWAYYDIIGVDATVSEAIGLLDYAVNTLNNRADHTQSATAIVKYPLMAVVDYDGAVDGYTAAAHELNGGVHVIPDNAIILNVFYDEITALDSVNDTATVTFTLTTATTALTGAIAVGGGTALGVPDFATNTDWIKTTAADSITATVGTQALTAGKLRLYIMYVVSE